MKNIELEPTISKINNGAPVIKDDYEEGIKLIDLLVSQYKKEVSDVATATTKIDCSMLSNEALKSRVKTEIKNQNPEFVIELAKLITNIQQNGTTFAAKPVSMNLRSLETKLSVTGYTKEEEAKIAEQMLQYDYNRQEAIMVLGFTAHEIAAEEDKSINWNKVIDATGKVAQTIFYLGNLFSKKEDGANTTPTIDQSSTDVTKSKSKSVINVVVISVIVIGLIIAGVLLFRKPKK